MLSSNSPQQIPEHFETVLDSIKAPLNNLYSRQHTITLREDLSDDQFVDLIAAVKQTETQWREKISLADFSQVALKELQTSITNDHSYPQETKPEPGTLEKIDAEEKEIYDLATVQAAHDKHIAMKIDYYEKNNLFFDAEDILAIDISKKIIDDFSKITLTWQLTIRNLYNTPGFIKFLAFMIGNKHIRMLHSMDKSAILTEAAITEIFFQCQHLPENYIQIFFNKVQFVTNDHARKLLLALPAIEAFIFTEFDGSLDDETAKALIIADRHDKIHNNGRGALKRFERHFAIIKSYDLARIFGEGIRCSTEDIEELTRRTTEPSDKHKLSIHSGDYTNPAWSAFFAKAIGENKTAIDELIISKHENLSFSKDVLTSLLKALRTNKDILKLEIGIPLDLEDTNLLAEALAENTSLSELNFNRQAFTTTTLTTLFNAITVNPDGKIVSLNLNYNFIGDTAADAFEFLLTANNRLTTLLLIGTGIRIHTCEAIGNALKTNTTLQTLSVAENELADQALMSILNGLLHNSTLSTLHTLQRTPFSQPCLDSLIRFEQCHYQTEYSAFMSRETLEASELMSIRNTRIRRYPRLRYFNDYIALSIVVLRDHYHGNHYQSYAFSKLGKPIIDLILSYFFLNKKTPDILNALLANNVLTNHWNTSADATQTAYYRTTTVRKKILERWVAPGEILTSHAVINKIKSNTIEAADLTGDYIDLQTTSLLTKALENNTSLTSLNLSMCHIDDDQMKMLYKALIRRALPLTALNLDNNHLTSASLPLLITLIANRLVKNLMVYNNTKDFIHSHKVEVLNSFAESSHVKVHFEAPIKLTLGGFFAPNRAREIVADSKEEKSVVPRRH